MAQPFDDEDLVRAYDAVILMGPYLRADVTAEERATITSDIVACVARPLRRTLADRGIVQRVAVHTADRTPALEPAMEASTGEMACSGPSDTGGPNDVKSRDPFSSPDHTLALAGAIFWLLRAYQSGHRQGWEPGPSTRETMDGLFTWLCGRGFDPTAPTTPPFVPQILAALQDTKGDHVG